MVLDHPVEQRRAAGTAFDVFQDLGQPELPLCHAGKLARHVTSDRPRFQARATFLTDGGLRAPQTCLTDASHLPRTRLSDASEGQAGKLVYTIAPEMPGART